MILSFACKQTHALFQNRRCKLPLGKALAVAYRKLVMIHSAGRLDDLRVPPGNRLEALRGDRQGQFSIRVNQQWRVCFAWRDGNAYDVAIVDYH